MFTSLESSANSVISFMHQLNSQSDTLKAGVLFIILLLILNIIDLLALWINKANKSFLNPFWQAIPFYLVLASPIFLLGFLTKIYLPIILLILLIIVLAEIVSAFKFKIPLEGDMFVIIAVSSPKEIKEFIANFLKPTTFIAGAIFLVVYLLLSYYFSRMTYEWNIYYVMVGLLLPIPFIITVIRSYKKRKFYKAFTRNPVTNLIAGYVINAKENHLLEAMAKKPQIPNNVHSLSSNNDDLVGVIVIGESSSRSHYGLYGYPRNTTPNLSGLQKELYTFKDVICAYCSTALAVRYAFTFANLKEAEPKCSLVDILKSTGYEVLFISNQYRWGKYDGPITLVFNSANDIEFLTEKNRTSPDIDLATRLDEILKTRKKKTIVIMQMIGSHIKYNCRYPENFGPFNDKKDNCNKDLTDNYAQLLNEYDNTIAYTDIVLSKMINTLKTLKIPSFLSFFSDHGETVENGINVFRSGKSKDPENYEIPFIVWLSEEYKKRFPGFPEQIEKNINTPIQTDNIITGLSDLARVSFDGFEEGKNIFSSQFTPVKRYMCGGEMDYDGFKKRKSQ